MVIGSKYKARMLKIYIIDSCTDIKCEDADGNRIDLAYINDDEIYEIKSKIETDFKTFYVAVKV